MNTNTFDSQALKILLDSNLTETQRSKRLSRLSKQAAVAVGCL